jgi:hypothetical protein
MTPNEYKLGYVDNSILVYHNTTLYLFDLPQDDTSNLIPSMKRENIRNTIFYDNNCFYIDKDGNLFVLDKETKNFIIYNEIQLTHGIDTAVIVKTETIFAAAKDRAEQWCNSFIQKIMENQDENIVLGKNEQKLFHRWIELKINHPTNDSKTDGVEFKDWYNDIYRKGNENLSAKKRELEDEFEKEWRVSPNSTIGLLSGDLSVYIGSTISMGKEIESYKGNNSELIMLVDFYNKLLLTYSEIIKQFGSSLPSDTNRLFETSYRNISMEIVKVAKIEQERINSAKNEYFAEKNAKIEEFKEYLITSFNETEFILNLDDFTTDEFGYIFLPTQKNMNGYTVIYKNISNNDIFENFKKVGQDIKTIAIYGNSLYVCEKGKVNFYDVFTLEPKNIINKIWLNDDGTQEISEKNEKVLFLLDPEKNIVVTEGRIFSRYYIRSIEEGAVSYRIMPVSIRMKSNTVFNVENMSNVPFITIKNIPDDCIYINVDKLKPKERTLIYRNFIYREMPSGAGIIFQRSKE